MAKTIESQGAAVSTASADKVASTPQFNYDDYHEAVSAVKGCAAALTALYVQDAGRLTYDAELFELLAHQLHTAARAFDSLTPALESL